MRIDLAEMNVLAFLCPSITFQGWCFRMHYDQTHRDIAELDFEVRAEAEEKGGAREEECSAMIRGKLSSAGSQWDFRGYGVKRDKRER
jgi:hypothetical protein